MAGIRPAAVAGQFYPDDPAALAAQVAACLGPALPGERPAPVPKAIIAPHAGYVYSGPVAGSAYARLAPLAGHIRRVVLAGPAHRAYVRGAAIPSASAFETPLGRVALDGDALAALRRLPFVETSDEAHAAEHSLEVQLPFLQAVLGEFRLVPVVIGGATPAQVAQLLDTVWGGAETLVVASTDLSHFLPYPEAARQDRLTAEAIVRREGPLEGEQACGAAVLNGLMALSGRKDLRIELVDLRNSGDTAGGRDRVVGYGAFLVFEPRVRDG
jgi:AmmeMemoRadiSam system protein B